MSSHAAAGSSFETEPLAPSSAPGTAHYALVLFHRNGAQVVRLSARQLIVVGRASPADVILPDASLSREHARFQLVDDHVRVEDLGSRNGTWLAGVRIESAVLQVGQRVSLGRVVSSLQLEPAADASLLGIESHDGFCLALEEELARARQLRRCVSLLMIRADGAHVCDFVERVRKYLRPVDRIGQYAAGVLEMFAPEMTLEQAHCLTDQLKASGAGGLPLLAGMASFPQSGQTFEELLARCKEDLEHGGALAGKRESSAVAGLGVGRGVSAAPDDFVASSLAMRQLVRQIDRLAQATIPVLLLGETGTGKEIVARAIHHRSARAKLPMVYVNCAAIPTQLVESTFFGHERGAFTGAVSQQKGLFETAHGSSLLLDEVGDLPLAAQAVLLRVLETRKVARVGSTREIDVDVRIMAATHRNLEESCSSGSFRWDLLYRLNVMCFMLPPLRARLEDLEALIERFILHANRVNGRQVRGVEPAALARLHAYNWPGNVRELRNVIDRAVVVAEDDEIRLEDLPQRLRTQPPGNEPGVSVPDGERTGTPGKEPSESVVLTAAEQRKRLTEIEVEMLLAAVRVSGGNKTEAARRIGMPLRTLVRKLSGLRSRGKP